MIRHLKPLILFLFLPFLIHGSELFQGKQLIGASTVVTIEQYGLDTLPARVDTGAKSSSIDCRGIIIDRSNRQVSCRPNGRGYIVTLPYSRLDTVKSSNGIREERAFVILHAGVEGQSIETEFSLRDRSAMTHPVLLGRSLLEGRFIVDVSR
jgi:hypothetical protein